MVRTLGLKEDPMNPDKPWTENGPNVVARGATQDGSFIYVKKTEGETDAAALERARSAHPEVSVWENAPTQAEAPQPGSTKSPAKKGRARAGAVLGTKDQIIPLKRAAAANPSAHEGVTYTDDAVDAANRGYVVAVSPRKATEILDPSVVTEEVNDVSEALTKLNVMTDEYVKNKIGNTQFGKQGMADARARFNRAR